MIVLVALLLTAAAWAVLQTRDTRTTRRADELHTNLLPRFGEAEFVRTTVAVGLGSRRGRVLTEEPDPRRLADATGLLSFPDGDPPYAWIVGRRAGFDLDVLEREDRTLSLRLAHGLGSEPRQEFRLLFNGREVLEDTLPLDGSPTSFDVEVPATLQRRGRNRVELVFARTESRQLQSVPVPLPLAALITTARFRTAAQVAADDTGPLIPPRFGVRRGTLDGEPRTEVLIPPEVCARLAMRLPDNDRVVLRLMLDAPHTPLEISLKLGASERVPLAHLEPEPDAPAGTTQRLDLDVGLWAGRDAVLELWSRAGERPNVLRVAQLRVPHEAEPPTPPRAPWDSAARPSFLVIVLDALARSRVGAYTGADGSLTPRLDALAARGLVVERASAPASYTLASVGALLTGLNPLQHGVVHLRDAAGFLRLRADTPRLAASLHKAGWRTTALVTNPNAGAAHGYDEGFEHYTELFRDESLWSDGVAGVHLAPRLDGFLESVHGEPFLAYVHVFEPHAPYDAPADLLAEHVQAYDGPARGDRAWIDSVKRGEVTPDDADWRHLRELYAARVALADRVLGELLDTLAASGRADDSFVLVTSDHGEAFGEHGWIEHGDHVFAEQVDVPLVLVGPGLAPTRLPGPATLEDVAPTLLPLAGVSVPPEMGGRDLLAAPDVQRPLHARSAAALPILSWTRWPWRLHVDTATRRERLHDLVRDPQERIDLARQEPSTALLLRQELTRALRAAASEQRGAERVEAADPEEVERLASLGYVSQGDVEATEGGSPPELLVLLSMLRRL